MFDFTVTILSNKPLMKELDSSRKEPSITFPPMKTGTTHVNEEREKVSPINSFSNAEPG